MLPFREAVRTAAGLGLPSARATFANSLKRRSSLFGALEHVWHQEALILTTLSLTRRDPQVCTLLVLVCSHHYTVGGVPEHDVCARLCVCGTDVVVLCAGLPAGTEDIGILLEYHRKPKKGGGTPAAPKMAAQSHYDLFEQLECARRPAAHSSSSSSARAALPPTVLTL